MTDPRDEQRPEAEPGRTSPGDLPGAPQGGPADGTVDGEQFIAAEGPDVETSLTDADEAFLADVSSGTASAEQPGAEQPGQRGQTGAEQPEPEHLADLRRVTAEYANYRRRTEREREALRERALGDAVRVLLPVLDDLDRAEAHGDLPEGGPFTTIASKLRAQVGRLGLVAFGEPGEAFDPRQHDAIFQRENDAVAAPTVADVVERGYRIGDTVLRVAKVVVDAPAG